MRKILNIFLLCRNLVFSEICSKKPATCLRQCVRGLRKLLGTSPKETSHPCHQVLNNESYPANVRRAMRRHLESHNAINVIPTCSALKCTQQSANLQQPQNRSVSRGSRPIGQPGSHKLALVTNRGGFDFMPIYKPYSGQRN
jgi:hypothetical protein